MFQAVAETGSFRIAANRLDVSPSDVSKAMTDLEERIGARLIARTTRNLSLTEAGTAYQSSVSTALAALGEGAETVQSITAEPRGLVRIAAPVNFGHIYLAPLLPRFVVRYPDVRVDALLSDGYIDPVGDGYDIVIRGAARLPDSTLLARRIMETPIVICASPDYIERCGTPSHPTDLTSHACLPLSSPTLLTDWMFDNAGDSREVLVDGPIRSSSIVVAHQAALAGVGIARLPYHIVAADIKAGRLVRLLLDFERSEGSLFLMYPAQRALALKARAFIDFFVAETDAVYS